MLVITVVVITNDKDIILHIHSTSWSPWKFLQAKCDCQSILILVEGSPTRRAWDMAKEVGKPDEVVWGVKDGRCELKGILCHEERSVR